MAVILASASPRRQELLRQAGCEFSVITSEVVEDNDAAVTPVELVLAQARAKALDVAARVSPEDVVIGADTVVVLAGRVFGKPRDETDARRMLGELSGRVHEVITGVAAVQGGTVRADHAVTEVAFRSLSAEDIERYLATGEHHDKAGAYAIQGKGALLVEGIAGCYANVVGLPLVILDRLLKGLSGVGLL